MVGGRAFVACDGRAVVAVELASGQELSQVSIFGEPDAVWYYANRERLYVAIGEAGMLEVVDTRAMAVVQQLETERRAHTTAFEAARQRLAVFLPNSCRAAVMRTCSRTRRAVRSPMHRGGVRHR